jgi:hypothetical protein
LPAVQRMFPSAKRHPLPGHEECVRRPCPCRFCLATCMRENQETRCLASRRPLEARFGSAVLFVFGARRPAAHHCEHVHFCNSPRTFRLCATASPVSVGSGYPASQQEADMKITTASNVWLKSVRDGGPIARGSQTILRDLRAGRAGEAKGPGGLRG